MKELPARDGARVFVDEIDGHVVIVRPFVVKLVPMGGRCHACGREMRSWSFREIGPNRVALDCSYCLTVHAQLELATEVDCYGGGHENEHRDAFIHPTPESVQ
jgi:hypothetical protein